MRIGENAHVGIFEIGVNASNSIMTDNLSIWTKNVDASVLIGTDGTKTESILKLANIPTGGVSSIAEVGFIQFQITDASGIQNICQIIGDLSNNSPKGQLHFHTMESGVDSERMRLSGANTAVEPLISLNGDLDTGFFLQSSNVIGFTTGGVERARLSAGSGSKLALKTGGVFGDLTICGIDASGNETNCGLSLNSATQTQMGVDNGAGIAALRMQMNSNSHNAIVFAANSGGNGTHALTISSSIATGNLTSPQGIIVDISGTTHGGIARASSQVVSNWQDGHLGNCEKIYFTATEFFPTDVSGGRYGALHIAPSGFFPSPTMAYGTNNWIATKLLPVGFQIKAGAKINILGQWADVSSNCHEEIQNLYVITTAVTTNGQQIFPSPPCPVVMGHEAVPTEHIVSFSGGGLIKALNTEHTLASASHTSGTGSYPLIATGGRTVIITIYVELKDGTTMMTPQPTVSPVLGQGIAGAYIEIARA